MKATPFLVLLPAASMAMPVSLADIGNLFTRQTAALNSATDRLLFSDSLNSFISSRNAKNPSGLDWTSDGCSYSPDNPFGFNFLPACYRHDFGYRNYKKQNRFTDSNKARIDSNFKSDMYGQCKNEKHKSECEDLANVYYNAVKEFGKREAEAMLEAKMDA